MKLREIRIQNFRSFDDETIRFDDYTCFVGPNGGGKSNVLTALNVFFRNTSSSATDVINLTKEDFHLKDVSKPIRITVTFGDLSDEATEKLKAYYRQEKLIVTASARWSGETQSATVEQHGERLVMKDFAPYFEADKAGAKVGELRAIYSGLQKNYPRLVENTVKAQMEAALREYEESHPELCSQEASPDQFYGWRGSNRLAPYIQWVYVPAVKDAVTEQEEAKATALGQLLDRTIRSKVDFSGDLAALKEETQEGYNSMLEKNRPVLDELSKSLESRLKDWSHAGSQLDLSWGYNPDKTIQVNEPFARILIGERDFLGEVARVGHGMQRSFIIALLQEEATTDVEGRPILILGIEEPELYQHPPQARHFAQLLERLSSDAVQPIVTTHSPYFVSGRGFEAVRMVRRRTTGSGTSITQLTYKALSEQLAEALGEAPTEPSMVMAQVEQIMQPSKAELFFTEVPVIVEGLEDVAFISTYMQVSGKWDDFRKFGCHFVVAEGKTNLSRPLGIATGLGIPAFVIFDADGNETDASERKKHGRDNRCLLRLCGGDADDPFPKETVWGENHVVWPTNIFDAVSSDFGTGWDEAEKLARTERGLTTRIKRKNVLLIGATVEILWAQSNKSETLEKLCNSIIAFANSNLAATRN